MVQYMICKCMCDGALCEQLSDIYSVLLSDPQWDIKILLAYKFVTAALKMYAPYIYIYIYICVCVCVYQYFHIYMCYI
jgi:hypothetical protein